MAVNADYIITRCSNLRKKWGTRNKKFRQWYELLLLSNPLEQEGMESVISNDPRTGFNMALHLLTSSVIAHAIPSEELKPEQISGTSYLESYMTKRWEALEASYRRMGRQSWMRDFVSLMLATGWYSIYVMADDNELTAEVWHPADVFPDYGIDGMVECAHIYTLSAEAANKKVKDMGWTIRSAFTGPTILYNHWGFDTDGSVANSIIIGMDFVKTPRKEPRLTELPILVSPVSGLPDRGSITGASKWQEHYGEAFVAVNEDIMLNYNKMLTFMQQLMRDTANPRWFEQSRGDTPILTEENLFKRGAIFRGSPEDQVGPLPVPPIPLELRAILFDYGNMIQRGQFPWMLHGNIQQQMAGYMMSQVASAAMQVLTPYELAIKGVLADIDNFWWTQLRDHKYKPHGFKMPSNLPADTEFKINFHIEIPGYLIQRATVARMLDPAFRLSTTTVMEKLFPEIKDSLREQARARKDDALMHPKAIAIDTIISWREQARILREAGDIEGAELYEKVAKAMEVELEGAPPAPPTGREVGGVPGIPREAMPREALMPTEGMGEVR